MYRLLLAVSFAVALLLVGSETPAWAQRTTATFSGIVVDNTGGILPGVGVVLTNEGTGVVEEQVTSAVGEFIFNYVPGGSYRLTISIAGFKTQTVTGISLGAAQTVRRRFELEVGEVAETITVSGEAPLISTASTEQRISLEAVELATLPVANRNISNLLNIGTGLTRHEGQVEGGGAGGSSAGTVRLRVHGLGGGAMSITLNGTEATSAAGMRSISAYNGVSKIDIVSIEAVGEVQIVKGILPAEFSNAMSGNLNIITKAGTNLWHGSLFDRYEGGGMVAKPFFLKERPKHTWNQYGGSVGGPLLRDRVFFFTAFEAYRETRALELNQNVPTQRFRDLLLTAMPFPETRLLLDQYPLPTEPVSATALTGTFIGPGDKENTDDHLDARVDVRIKGGNLSGTFTYGHPFLSQANTARSRPLTFTTTIRRATGSYAVTRGRWSAETRSGYNYNYYARTNPGILLLDPVNPGPMEPVTAKDRRILPMISFPGLQQIGNEMHNRGSLPSYSFEQQFTLVTDKHGFKFGAIYARPRGGRDQLSNPSLSYQTEAEIVANRPSSASFNPVLLRSNYYSTDWGLFVQDDWRVNSKLVVNMGVRYDYYGRLKIIGLDPEHPAGFVNLDGQPDPSFTFGPPRDPDVFVEDDKFNLGPRIGLVYNLDGQGRTVVNGGWGLLFQASPAHTFESTNIGMIAGIPSSRSYSAAEVAALGLKYPTYNEDVARILEATLGDNPDPVTRVGPLFDPQIQAPYAQVFTVGMQRALGSTMMVEAGYVGTRGERFRLNRTYNLPDRVTGLRPNPSLNQNRYVGDEGATRYHALQTAIRRRLTNRVSFNLNYTWSSARMNSDGDNGGSSINDIGATNQEFFDLDADWGPATGDVTHNFIGNVIYETPGAAWSSPLARQLLGSWQVAGIFRVRSGEPLHVTQTGRPGARPDVIDAANAVNKDCCDLNSNILQYLNPAAFQLVPLHPVSRQPVRAGTGRVNQFRLPGFRNIDVSLSKYFNVGGQRRIEVRADILNALNAINYFAASTNYNASNFGQITGTAAARVVQLQARLSF